MIRNRSGLCWGIPTMRGVGNMKSSESSSTAILFFFSNDWRVDVEITGGAVKGRRSRGYAQKNCHATSFVLDLLEIKIISSSQSKNLGKPTG